MTIQIYVTILILLDYVIGIGLWYLCLCKSNLAQFLEEFKYFHQEREYLFFLRKRIVASFKSADMKFKEGEPA